ncbi:MAG: GNAT family N-acetyltransferase [Micromonosporaceae bacterium]|nr:GNAT family N-acetyltransferase [Micromonosporaceae bacterium]
MEPAISRLDPADQPTVEAVQALRVAAEAADVPDFPPPCPFALRGELTFPRTSKRTEHFVARTAGEVTGYLALELPLRENLDNVDASLTVHPAHRRRGVGRALHAYLLERMRDLGRIRYASGTVEALPGGPARDDGGRAFATAMGAKPALDEVRRRLDLTTLDEPAVAAMLDQARTKAAGYQVVTWSGPAPEEYAADVGYLDGRLVSDAPMGDLQWEAPTIDVARLRESEDAVAAARWHLHSAGAVHEATGRMVALTAVARQETSPWHAFQWITLVDPAHRGHRLGALVKVENLRYARSQEPELRVIDTWNAAVNQHMISINEAMGFRPVDSWVNWQQEI